MPHSARNRPKAYPAPHKPSVRHAVQAKIRAAVTRMRRGAATYRRRLAAAHRQADDVYFQAQVARLTNWQRKRWARAGYPGLRDRSMRPSPVERYALLQRRPASKAAE